MHLLSLASPSYADDVEDILIDRCRKEQEDKSEGRLCGLPNAGRISTFTPFSQSHHRANTRRLSKDQIQEDRQIFGLDATAVGLDTRPAVEQNNRGKEAERDKHIDILLLSGSTEERRSNLGVRADRWKAIWRTSHAPIPPVSRCKTQIQLNLFRLSAAAKRENKPLVTVENLPVKFVTKS